MQGLHILAELYDCACSPERLLRPDALEGLCRAACDGGGLTIVTAAFHGFGTTEHPAGATGAVVLAESHLAIHTWPEIGAGGAVTLDLYVCNFSRDNRQAAELAFAFLVNAFMPLRVVRRDVHRGLGYQASPDRAEIDLAQSGARSATDRGIQSNGRP